MAFNANTYYANKYRRRAWAALKKARELKAQIAAGTAYDWEKDRVPLYVLDARLDMHLSLSYRFLRSLQQNP